MTVAVYLAARYQERDRIEELAGKLRQDGIEVASHWHWGPEYTDLAEAAQRDRADIERADALVLFTQEPEAGDWPTGGRHVEFGMALALGKKTIVAGPAENIFCLLPRSYLAREPGRDRHSGCAKIRARRLQNHPAIIEEAAIEAND